MTIEILKREDKLSWKDECVRSIFISLLGVFVRVVRGGLPLIYTCSAACISAVMAVLF